MPRHALTAGADDHDASDPTTFDFLLEADVPAASIPGEPARPDRPYVSASVASVSGYRPLPRLAYAVVLYSTTAGRVGAVVAPFGDALSAEQYALDSRFPSYDVVPATSVAQAAP